MNKSRCESARGPGGAQPAHRQELSGIHLATQTHRGKHGAHFSINSSIDECENEPDLHFYFVWQILHMSWVQFPSMSLSSFQVPVKQRYSPTFLQDLNTLYFSYNYIACLFCISFLFGRTKKLHLYIFLYVDLIYEWRPWVHKILFVLPRVTFFYYIQLMSSFFGHEIH